MRCTTSGLVAVLLFAAGALFLSDRATAVDVGQIRLVLDGPVATGNSGTFSCYAYKESTNEFYVGIFGSGAAGLRKVTGSGTPWQEGNYTTSLDMVERSLINRFIRSGDVPGGQFDPDDSAPTTISGILLNPAPLTIDVPDHDAAGIPNGGTRTVTYQPGELAFVVDHIGMVIDSGTYRPEWTKNIFRWDLREVGAATTRFPDYSTGVPMATGYTGWNDTLAPVFTAEQMRSAYTAATGKTASLTERSNFGRQPVWSSDGQYLYAIDSGKELGGLYKVNAATGAAQLIYSESSDVSTSNVIAEPGVVPTSVCDFGAGFGSGDQILFDGTEAGGNPGDLVYVVDTGTAVSAPKVLIDMADFRDYSELPILDEDNDPIYPGARSITADAAGTVYFYEVETQAIHARDSQGRLSCILNKAQLHQYNYEIDGSRSNGGGLLRMQTIENAEGTFITFRGDNRYVGAIPVTLGGDLNSDGELTPEDTARLIVQYKKTCYETFPQIDPTTYGAPDDYVDYINCDINGSGNPDAGNFGLIEDPAIVTWKDVEVLAQFIPLETGDFDWDGDVLDDDDWDAFNAAYNLSREDVGGIGIWSWFDGDVTGDGLVNEADLALLESIGPDLAGDLNGDGAVNSTDLDIIRGNWGSSVLPGDISQGDANGDGRVDSSDLDVVRANWGQTAAASAVPEPSVAVLIAAWFAVFAGIRRR